MYIQNVYQSFAHINANRLAFGVLIHQSNEHMEQVELFSMAEDNRTLFSQAMSFEGVRLQLADIENIICNGISTPVLAISKCPRAITLFSLNLYFGLVDCETGSQASDGSTETILTEHEFNIIERKNSQLLCAECTQPIRSLLTNTLLEKDDVYVVGQHCLSDFLDEADMEIKEYVLSWNKKGKVQDQLMLSK